MRFAHGHYGGIMRSLHTVMMCLPHGVHGEAILAAAWRPRRFVLCNAAGDSPDLVFWVYRFTNLIGACMDSLFSGDGMRRRSFLKLVIAAGGATAAAAAMPRTARAAEAEVYPSKFTFAVMSDVHYFSPSLYGDNEDYVTAENSDRKMFRESSDILDKALADIVAAKPNMVIVPGDLTKDGERVCHEEVKEKFDAAREQLEAAGVNTQFYVINGNHDLNNHNGKDFSGGTAEDADRTDPSEYKGEIWTACGYTDTTAYDLGGTADGSLSYVAQPCPGLTLIAVDTCKYNVDAGDGTLAQETSGHISDDLLEWVCEQAKQARAAGDVVVAMQHHGIVPHFGYEPVIFGEYLVDDYERVAQAYAEAGISAVFTGHMHANDIAAATYGDATIYDIETGSLVTYPSRMRMGSFAFAQDGDELSCTLTVDSHDLGQVTLDSCGLTAGAQDIEDYGKERTLTVESVQTMLEGYAIDPLVAQIDAAGSIKPVIAGLVGCEPAALGEAAWGLLASALPASPEAAVEAGLSFSISSLGTIAIYYNSETDCIEAAEPAEGTDEAALALDLESDEAAEFATALATTPMTMAAGELVLHIEHTAFTAFLDKLIAELDAKVVMDDTGRAAFLGIVNDLVAALLASPVDAEAAHTVLALVDFAYQDHLLGCETQEQWVESAIAAIGDSEQNLLGAIVGARLDEALAGSEFMGLAQTVTFDLNELIVGDNTLGKLAMMLLLGNKKNLAELLQLLTGSFDLKLGGTVGGLLTGIELMGEPIPALAQNALSTLCHDDNVAEDHNFSLAASATIPSGGSDGDEVDKSGLQQVIDQAGALDTTGASQSALDELSAALALAQRVASNPDASAEDVASAQARLERAIKAVEESKRGGAGGNGGSGTSDDGSSNGSDDTGNGNDKLTSTGDASLIPVAASALGGAAALAAGLGVRHHMNAANLDE